jgi:hypothetical protein
MVMGGGAKEFIQASMVGILDPEALGGVMVEAFDRMNAARFPWMTTSQAVTGTWRLPW